MENDYETKQLSDEKCANITGGNRGDANNDMGEKPMYSVGQAVEVYNTMFHKSTFSATIYMIRKNEIDGYYEYRMLMRDGKTVGTTWYSANDIERK